MTRGGSRFGVGLGVGLVAATLLAGGSCKVLNQDHCANKDVPGNEFCRELYDEAAAFCSPCRRELHGCVQNPPFQCAGYYDEVSEDDMDGATPMDESSSSGGTPGSSGPGSTDSGGSTGGTSDSDGTGSGATSSSSG